MYSGVNACRSTSQQRSIGRVANFDTLVLDDGHRRLSRLDLPAATQGFNQLNTGHHLLHPKGHGDPLIVEQGCLRGGDAEVTVDAGLVAEVFERQKALRRFDGGILLSKFL